MKCPYLTRTIQMEFPQPTRLVECEQGNDEAEQVLVACNIMHVVVSELHSDCIEADCAAWEDGSCKYRG